MVWLWVPNKLDNLAVETNEFDLYVWNSDFEGSTVLFATIDSDAHYKGLILVRVSGETLLKQQHLLNATEIEAAPWPEAGQSLREVIDAMNAAESPEKTISIFKAVAIQASSQLEDLGSRDLVLSSWLSSTLRQKNRSCPFP